MFKKLFILIAAFFTFISPSLATDLLLGDPSQGGENIWLSNMWDRRTIHSSLDVGGRVGSPGGWFISLSGPLSSSMGQVSRVEVTGAKRTIVLTQGEPYYWLGSEDTGFNIWFGNRTEADDNFWLRCYDQNGDLMDIYENGEYVGDAYGPICPHIDLPDVAFVRIKNMKVRKNDLMVKVEVPEDFAGRTIQLRLRIYDGQDTDRLIKEYKYTEGLPGIVKLSVPMAYAGCSARFEYRVFDSSYPLARTVTWLTLPSP